MTSAKDETMKPEQKTASFPAYFPEFTWDRIPVYQMFGDRTILTDEQRQEVSPTSTFLCIEKDHGLVSDGAADTGAGVEIGRIKALRPETTALVYMNSAFAYPFISRSKYFAWKEAIHRPENAKYKALLLTDPETGALAFREGDHVHFFDVLNPALREWWVETVGLFVREAGGDGLFVDQMHGFDWLRPDRKAEVAEAQALMMRQAKEAIGKEKILLLNNAAHIPALFEAGDAFMFEHYLPQLLDKEQILADWKLMRKISEAGKIGVWRIGVEQDLATQAERERGGKVSREFLEALSRRRITYYLAAFLIGAREQSYFQYGWGWGLYTGPLCGYPELKLSPGRPRGDYTRDDPEGWVFRREFEQATVMVDLEKREGTIDWKKA